MSLAQLASHGSFAMQGSTLKHVTHKGRHMQQHKAHNAYHQPNNNVGSLWWLLMCSTQRWERKMQRKRLQSTQLSCPKLHMQPSMSRAAHL